MIEDLRFIIRDGKRILQYGRHVYPNIHWIDVPLFDGEQEEELEPNTDFQQKTSPSKQTKLIPVTCWNQHHQWPTQSGLRYWIHNAKTNGFDKVVRRVGRRVLIDEPAFFKWVEEQGGDT